MACVAVRVGAVKLGDVMDAGDASATFTGGISRDGSGSAVGSGKLVTVSALSQPPSGGSGSEPRVVIAGTSFVVEGAGARGAPGATAGARGDCALPMGGTGWPARGTEGD